MHQVVVEDERPAAAANDPVRSADFSRWLDSADLPVDTVEFRLATGARGRHEPCELSRYE